MKHEKIGKSEYREIVSDQKENIGGLVTTRIGAMEKRTIGANMKTGDSPDNFKQDIEIFGNQDIQINVDKTESVDGVLDLGVALDAAMTFSQKWNVTTGSDLIINSQSILDVDAIGNITMTTPANVDVDGARIDLN